MTRKIGLNEIIPTELLNNTQRILAKYDIIHFHDLNKAISPLTLYLCSKKRTVFFTAHDCSCFTGGCIYPNICKGYLHKCGRCPQLGNLDALFDFTSFNLSLNRWLARQEAVRYVFPSNWLFATACKSLQFSEKAIVVPNGFNSKPYDFQPKALARKKLGISDKQKVILVAAHYLADPRKGMTFALEAIHRVRDLGILVIFIGIPPIDIEIKMCGIQFWLAGFVRDRKRIGLLFAATDIFLFTSLEENLPIMLQESLAAGTAVVGFASGGVPEVVQDNHSGLLCATGDINALEKNLRDALNSENLCVMGQNGKRMVEERFDMKAFGERHLQLYEESLAKK